MASVKTEPKRRIVFLHPDLGIGGAERLIVDVAVGLQQRGHAVTIFTSHCDPGHCFEEARDGTLDVRVRGNTIVPQTLLGRFWIICAILRQIHLILYICLFTTELRDLQPDALFVDQLSAGIPLLRTLCAATKIIFYCHFPDKLLAQRNSLLKRLYRWPFDWLESWSTGCSDKIVVNSKFTRSIFQRSFPRLRSRMPSVVYPCVDTTRELQHTGRSLWPSRKMFLSINRYERKKDVGLALRAYAGLTVAERRTCRLVIAGGYDLRNAENREYHHELEALAETLGFTHATFRTVLTAQAVPDDTDVLFLQSVPSALKDSLLASANLLMYTPLHEHFGIVPLEAMLAGVPVLAADQGGPTETVSDGVTGWLRDTRDTQAWTTVMHEVLSQIPNEQLARMGKAGQTRVKMLFSKAQMSMTLEQEISSMLESHVRPPIIGSAVALWAFSVAVAVLCGAGYSLAMR